MIVDQKPFVLHIYHSTAVVKMTLQETPSELGATVDLPSVDQDWKSASQHSDIESLPDLNQVCDKIDTVLCLLQ